MKFKSFGFSILLGIAALIIVNYFFFMISSFGNYSSNTKNLAITSSVVNLPFSCPADYCGNWVYGSCIGKGLRYKERLCYQYPTNAENLSECQSNVQTYYEKGNQADSSC